MKWSVSLLLVLPALALAQEWNWNFDTAQLGEWEKIRVTRSTEGRVEAFVDDMENPTLTAEDTKWLSGRTGIGSFNDAAQFDLIKLTGN